MWYVYVLVTLVVMTILYFLYSNIQSKVTKEVAGQLYEATEKNDIKSFDEALGSKKAQFWITPYNATYSRIRFAIVNNNMKLAKELCDYVLPLKIRKREKANLLSMLFTFFVENKEREYTLKVRAVLEPILAIGTNAKYVIHDMDLLVGIYLDANPEYIEELEKMINENEGEIKVISQVRLAALYHNLNQNSKAISCLEQAKKNSNKNDTINKLIKEYSNVKKYQ